MTTLQENNKHTTSSTTNTLLKYIRGVNVGGWLPRVKVTVLLFSVCWTRVVSGLDIGTNKSHILARRQCISQMTSSLMTLLPATVTTITPLAIVPSDTHMTANAAETIGKDPNCNDASCLGVWDGLLADCPHDKKNNFKFGRSGCASSQDDTPGVFAEPWDYSDVITASTKDDDNYDPYEEQMRLLVPAIQLVSAKRGDTVEILVKEGRYLRVQFTDANTMEESIGEFYFTPNDTTVQFRVAGRAASTPSGALSSLQNLDRCELIRKQLRYTKVPVLRNRKRVLFFAESDWDTFGPGSASLGPPAEMTTGELEGRGSEDVDPNLKIDFLQIFPKSSRP
jgi:hypothetical protein